MFSAAGPVTQFSLRSRRDDLLRSHHAPRANNPQLKRDLAREKQWRTCQSAGFAPEKREKTSCRISHSALETKEWRARGALVWHESGADQLCEKSR